MNKYFADKHLAPFKSNEDEAVLYIVMNDEAIAKALAAWPFVNKTFFEESEWSNSNQLLSTWEWLWSETVGCNPNDLARLVFGEHLPSDECLQFFTRMKALHLIYPDGTVHSKAKILLMGEVKLEVDRISKSAGQTMQNPDVHSSSFIRTISPLVKERDNYTCQICGKTASKTSRELNVHHIDQNKGNDSISNLITICVGCHNKIHKTQSVG